MRLVLSFGATRDFSRSFRSSNAFRIASVFVSRAISATSAASRSTSVFLIFSAILHPYTKILPFTPFRFALILLTMPLVHAIVLGIVQGLTEFLPVSSSAHLIIVPWLLGWDDGGLTFDVALHVGTLVSVILYFFRDWVQIIAQGFGLTIGGDSGLSKNRNLLWLLVAATIPGGLIGYLFEKQAETSLRSPYVIASTAIGIGIVMWLAERFGRKQKD